MERRCLHDNDDDDDDDDDKPLITGRFVDTDDHLLWVAGIIVVLWHLPWWSTATATDSTDCWLHCRLSLLGLLLILNGTIPTVAHGFCWRHATSVYQHKQYTLQTHSTALFEDNQSETVKIRGRVLPKPGRQFCLRNDLYCVGWGVKVYSLTHSGWQNWSPTLQPKLHDNGHWASALHGGLFNSPLIAATWYTHVRELLAQGSIAQWVRIKTEATGCKSAALTTWQWAKNDMGLDGIRNEHQRQYPTWMVTDTPIRRMLRSYTSTSASTLLLCHPNS